MEDERLEILNKIDLQLSVDDKQGKIKLSSYVGGGEIANLCELIGEYNPREKEGFFFWYQKLSKKEFLKIYMIIEAIQMSDEAERQLVTICDIAISLLHEALTFPCEVSLGDKELECYIPDNIFEESHNRTHDLMEIITNLNHNGGWVKRIHKN